MGNGSGTAASGGRAATASGDRAALHGAVAARLGAAGQRYSSRRRALVEALARASRPLTSPEVAAADPRLALSSVYRNLAVLVEVGVARRLASHGDTARYELAEAFSEHHHHLVCDRCGAVLDYEAPPGLERSLRRGLAAVRAETGFQPRAHALEILGICAACAAAG